MAGTLEDYKRLFREAHVADQKKLLQLHVIIYIVVNIIWLALNYMGSIKVEPTWAMWYSPVGWGLLIVVHWWFFVRNAENLCKLKEVATESKMR
ncbi:MAG: 2TM domain-containing protein [Methanotrichaceae archaeon]|nr:2TM domain-containing protein [Methanotrichaceae archaeon]